MTTTSPANSRILIVEDQPLFREILAAALTTHGHIIEVAADGREAERRLSSESFDLIITDILMPEQDGIQTIMNLHASNNPIPIIAMTGSHMYTEIYLRTAKALGATRVLTKPFGMRELLDATSDALSGSQPAGHVPERQ